ncbi:MAG: cyclic nucleotide-binding domain-containing protein [Nitrospiraceae bacterium]
MEVGDLLKQTPLFKNLSGGELDILAQSTRIRTYRTGQVIIREDRVGTAFFVLVSGSVEVVKGIGGSEPVVLATLGAGEFFGEIGTMKHVTRSASVRALQDTKCLVIWRLDFEAYIRRFPDVTAKVESALSARFDD